MLNRPTRQIILAAGRAAGVPLDLIQAGLALMEGRTARSTGPQPLLVNQATAARLLSVSRFTVRRLVAEGYLRPVHVRGAVRYSRVDLERLAGMAGPERSNESDRPSATGPTPIS